MYNEEAEETIRTYEILASKYDRRPWGIIRLVERLLPEKTVYIGDIGCGKGQYTRYLLERKKKIKIIALDLAQGMVYNMYNSVKKYERYRVLPIVADATSLPIANEKLYATLYIAVLHHILAEKDRNTALKEAYRVVKPRGYVFITVWALYQPYFIIHVLKNLFKKIFMLKRVRIKMYVKGRTHKRYYYLYSLKELLRELEEAGFIIIDKGVFYPVKKIFRPTKNYYVLAVREDK